MVHMCEVHMYNVPQENEGPGHLIESTQYTNSSKFPDPDRMLLK